MSFGQPVLTRRILTVVLILPLFLAALFGLPQPVWGAVILAVVILACIEWGALTALEGSARLGFVAVVALACVALGFLQPRPVGVLVLALAVLFWLAVLLHWIRGLPSRAAGSPGGRRRLPRRPATGSWRPG